MHYMQIIWQLIRPRAQPSMCFSRAYRMLPFCRLLPAQPWQRLRSLSWLLCLITPGGRHLVRCLRKR